MLTEPQIFVARPFTDWLKKAHDGCVADEDINSPGTGESIERCVHLSCLVHIRRRDIYFDFWALPLNRCFRIQKWLQLST